MDANELAFAGIARQARLLREREVSSVELVEVLLARVERLGPALNPFTVVLAERAREEAEEADRRLGAGEEGALLGVPVALKDEVDVAGIVTSHGTAAYPAPAAEDSAHWRRLRGAGAILLGKTTLPELAICGFTETETFGETRNPWDVSRTPGGSSGGSAAAVAAGLVGAASASDGAGSIRIPAANCGLVGLKPQRGRISLQPGIPPWLGLTCEGTVTRRVADTALWLDVAAGSEPGDADRPPPPERSYVAAAASDPGRLRIAWSLSAPRALAPPILDDRCADALHRVAGSLAAAGHHVEEQDPAWGLLGNDFANLYLKGIETHYDTVPHPERLEARTRGFKRLARLIPERLLRRSQAQQARHTERLNRVFDRNDLLLMPTVGCPPVEVGRWADRGALRTVLGMSRVYPYTGPWNFTGQPAAAVPAGLTPEGLPLSVQLVAPPNREDLLLSVGSQLERELGWTKTVPPIAA
jgi:amidase